MKVMPGAYITKHLITHEMTDEMMISHDQIYCLPHCVHVFDGHVTNDIKYLLFRSISLCQAVPSLWQISISTLFADRSEKTISQYKYTVINNHAPSLFPTLW